MTIHVYAFEIECIPSQQSGGYIHRDMTEKSIIVDITIPAESFELGRIFEDIPGISVQLERTVPLQSEPLPLFRVADGDEAAIKAALQDHSQIKRVRLLMTTETGEKLFEVRWQPGLNGLIRAMIETNARLLKAEGNADEWKFRLRFATNEDLTAFNQAATDNGIPLTLQQLYNPTEPDEQSPISDKQRDAIEQAYRRGYFNVPRDSTVADLAGTMDISDSAFSQRLRRGLSTLIRKTLISDDAGGK